MKTRSPNVLFDLIQRTKDAVRELDSQIGSRFKKLLVESPAANHHTGAGTHAPAAAAVDIDDDDDDDSSVSDTYNNNKNNNNTHAHQHLFYSPLDSVWDYLGELVPEPVWILLKQDSEW